MAYLYFAIEYAIKTHDKILEISGGIHGIIDHGRLDSILQHIQNDDYYFEFESKLTHLVYSVNKSHCFNDGNKRTSIALGAFFLEINGLDVLVTKFIREMENVAVAVADNLISKELLYEIIHSLINDEEYDEELKLKIIQALSA
jgi:death-on-curing protein